MEYLRYMNAPNIAIDRAISSIEKTERKLNRLSYKTDRAISQLDMLQDDIFKSGKEDYVWIQEKLTIIKELLEGGK